MGTRNLTVVKYNNDIKIAQYGQWDGYPEGQGRVIVDFLMGDGNVEKLKEKLGRVRFIDHEGQDKKFIESYNEKAPSFSSDPDNRSDEEKEWWDTFMTRDLGAEILKNVANSNKEEIILNDSFDFGNDSLFCEYAYVVDLDQDLLYVYEGFQEKPHNKGLWANLDKQESDEDNEYYPVKPIGKMAIDLEKIDESFTSFVNEYNKNKDNE